MILAKLAFSSFAITVCCGQLLAAEINVASYTNFNKPVGILISGKIVKGDFQRFGRLIDPTENWNNYKGYLIGGVHLDSPGGDVAEAMRIAQLVERSFVSTTVKSGNSCLSSCFLIFAAGMQRVWSGSSRLGVHRISLVGEELDLNKYGKATMEASQAVENFLVRVGTPRKLIEKMNDTPPSEMYFLSFDWLEREGIYSTLLSRPAFLDSVEKKCGKHPLTAATLDRKVSQAQLEKFVACGSVILEKNQEANTADIFRAAHKAASNEDFIRYVPRK